MLLARSSLWGISLAANLLLQFLARSEVLAKDTNTEIRMIGARPAGQCTCERAATENTKPAGSTCACGARPASESTAPFILSSAPRLYFHTTCSNTNQLDACSCEKASDGGTLPTETDFTTKAAGA